MLKNRIEIVAEELSDMHLVVKWHWPGSVSRLVNTEQENWPSRESLFVPNMSFLVTSTWTKKFRNVTLLIKASRLR